MDRFKMLIRSEAGINLTNSYNGHLPPREAGSVSSQVDKRMLPTQSTRFERNNRISMGHVRKVEYIAVITT